MRKNISKLLAIFIAIVFVLSLVGCGSPPASTAATSAAASTVAAAPAATPAEPAKTEPVKLTLWHWWSSDSDGNTAAFKTVVDDFTKEVPGVKLDAIPQTSGDQYFTKLKVALASSEGPDIYLLQGLGAMKPYVDGGKALALNDLIAKNGTESKLVGGTLGNFTFDGKYYALPISMSIGVLYCNKDLFDKNGVKLPETFDDLLAAAKVFSAKGITPIIVGGGDRWPAMFYYDIMAIRTAGVQGSVDALTNKASFDSPAFIDAAKKLQELGKAKAFNSSMLSMKWDEAQQNFIHNKGAMVFNGSWVSSLCEGADSEVKGKIVAMKFPTIDGAAGKSTEFFGGANDSFVINPQTKNADAAFTTVQWLCMDMGKQSYITGSGLPAWKLENIDVSKINPLIVQQTDLIKDATSFCMWWDTFLGGKKADAHTALVIQLLANKITPENYAKEMQKQVNETP